VVKGKLGERVGIEQKKTKRQKRGKCVGVVVYRQKYIPYRGTERKFEIGEQLRDIRGREGKTKKHRVKWGKEGNEVGGKEKKN